MNRSVIVSAIVVSMVTSTGCSRESKPSLTALPPGPVEEPDSPESSGVQSAIEEDAPAAVARDTYDLGRLAGRVVDERGQPIAGATLRQIHEITLFGVSTGASEVVGDPATTDADGRFEVPRVGWKVTIEARAEGRSPATCAVSAASADVVTVPDLVLHPGRSMRGVVLSKDGDPIAGALVVIVDEKSVIASPWVGDEGISYQPGADAHPVFTDDDGRFEASSLLDEPYVVCVTGTEFGEKRVTLRPGDSAVTITLDR